jgi:phosphatidylserine/phosphatidylglycerophosphate/cardiolipin synthase-like enzyme
MLTWCLAVQRPRYADVWFRLEELTKYDNFVLAGLAVNNDARRSGYQIEYVHSKVGARHTAPPKRHRDAHLLSRVQLAIVDGEWFTAGSANLVDISMEKDHTELNVSVWDKPVAFRLLSDLFHEHTGRKRFLTRLCGATCMLGSFTACAVETAGLTDVEMVRALQRVARANRQAILRGTLT